MYTYMCTHVFMSMNISQGAGRLRREHRVPQAHGHIYIYIYTYDTLYAAYSNIL